MSEPDKTADKILVVDDTPANLVAAEAALAELERPLVMARSGEEALSRLLQQDFSLALLDVQMPGMNGLELARLIRSRPRSSHMPIIFITAFSHDDDDMVMQAYDLGAVDFLFKPVRPEILRAKASSLISLQQRTQELAYERLARDFDSQRRDLEAQSLRRAQDHEVEAKRFAEQTDRRKDNFLAMLAHELRNPLAPIRTAIDLIRRDPQAAAAASALDVLDRQTTVMSRLVDDLLDLSRITADKIELRKELVAVTDVFELALTSSLPLAADKGQTLTVGAIPDVTISADLVRLAQVITNVVTNAVRYTPQHGRIDIRVTATGDRLSVSVTDTGIGIPLGLQSSIFEAFVQERVSLSGSGGLGLGLAMAKRLVELHGGTISVASEGRDRGSTFEITVPLATAEPASASRAPTTSPQTVGTAHTAREGEAIPLTIAVIDDNDDARELLSILLEGEGYEVHQARDGQSGIDLVEKIRPDVAVIDIGLPDMTGIDVAKTLRQRDPALATRLVALTGYGDPGIRASTRAAGFETHMVKPVTAATVLNYMRTQRPSRTN